MSPSELRAKLQGVIGFPVTPFKSDLSLDIGGFRRNLQAMLRHAPAAIVAAGGTGELYSLSVSEHAEVVRAAVEEVAGAMPVIAGAGFNARIGADLARQAAAAGASGILAFPPYYPGAEDEGLFEYLPDHRFGIGPRTADLQPRLVPSITGSRRAADSD